MLHVGHTDARRFPIADHFTTLALMNKQDYAHLHGLEVHLSAQNVDTKATVRSLVMPGQPLCSLHARRCSGATVDIRALICRSHDVPQKGFHVRLLFVS